MQNNKFIHYVQKIDRIFSSFIKAICILLLVSIIGTITVSVFTRFVMFTPLNFTDSLATYLMIWLCFLGIGLAFRENEHVSVDMFINKLNHKNKKVLLILSNIFISVFLLIVIFYGVIFAIKGSGSYDPIVFGISMSIPYLSVSFGALYALIQLNIVTITNIMEVE